MGAGTFATAMLLADAWAVYRLFAEVLVGAVLYAAILVLLRVDVLSEIRISCETSSDAGTATERSLC